MEFIQLIIDFILHIDVHLAQLVADYGTWVYAILFVIIFCETGLVVTPFLPGDSLLFMAGALSAIPGSAIEAEVMVGILIVAAVGGDALNYTIGKFFGKKLFSNPDSKIFKQKYLKKTEDFYAKYGGKTIFLARFVPIVRTFAPFVAGMGKMSYKRFGTFNIVGGICWVSLFTFAGKLFGNIDIVQRNLKLIVVAIIMISVMPAVIEVIREKRKAKASV
ncbi:MAG: DedA family protein [Ignavibacteria bacterium]|jgi:membrane-associated protein|nr:DedA family protein [Ignavibacteria bacterium]